MGNLKKKLGNDWGNGFAGLLGFGGFQYFRTGDVSKLFFFAYFGFFVYFGISLLTRGVQDERMVANQKSAWAISGRVAFAILGLMGLSSLFVPLSELFFIAACTIGFFLSLLTYFISFIILERRS